MRVHNLKFLPLPATSSWDNSDLSSGWGLRTPNLGEVEAVGVGVVSFERALVSFYRPSIVTFTQNACVSEILPFFVLQHATCSHHTSTHPRFLHVLQGVGGWPLGYEERICRANCRVISFQDCQPMWSWYTNVTDRWTDRQTDRRHAIAIPRYALQRVARYKLS